MRSNYCIKCGQQVTAQLPNCENCKAQIIEMPLSDAQTEFIENVQKQHAKNPPSKVKGCLVTLLVFGLMFGVPGVLAYSGIGIDSIVGLSLTTIVLVVLNVFIFKHRQTIQYKQKRYYILSEKTDRDFADRPMTCQCGQPLTSDMIHCPKCGLHVHEDIPVSISRKMINKHCGNCGTNIEGKKFCPECGTQAEVI